MRYREIINELMTNPDYREYKEDMLEKENSIEDFFTMYPDALPSWIKWFNGEEMNDSD